MPNLGCLGPTAIADVANSSGKGVGPNLKHLKHHQFLHPVTLREKPPRVEVPKVIPGPLVTMQDTFHGCPMPNPTVPEACQLKSTLSRGSTIPTKGTRVPRPGHTDNIPSPTTSLHQRHTTRHSTAHSNTRQFLATMYNCKGFMQSADYITT